MHCLTMKKKNDYYTEELEKSTNEKMRALEYQKYFTGGLGLFGFTIKKHISIAPELTK